MNNKKITLQNEINIDDIQTEVEFSKEIMSLLKRAAELTLEKENFCLNSEISIILVNDNYITEINNKHRNMNTPTDVLSFPMVNMENGKIISSTGDYDMEKNLLVLGDIVISAETAKRNAAKYDHSLEREMVFLTIHGLYHLLGYNHEYEAEEIIMIKKQKVILEEMCLK